MSIRRQCQLIGLGRATYYREPAGESAENLRLMRLIDEQYTACPFYGSRRITRWLARHGHEVNRKRVQRLLRLMGLEAIHPKPKLSAAPRIMGLDGKQKMSKSREANAINLEDPPKVIEKKLKGAFTDPLKLKMGDPGRPEICNIFTIHKAATDPSAVPDIDQGCRSGALGCGECKMRLRDSIVRDLEPLQARYAEIRAKPKLVTDVLAAGAEKARGIAQQTMREVHGAMGLTLASQSQVTG